MYVGLWPCKWRVVAFARKREITGEPLNSRSQILAPNRREITGFDCILLEIDLKQNKTSWKIFITFGDKKSSSPNGPPLGRSNDL